jgi:twinkle protein
LGTIITRNQPCLDTVGCGSSDARQIYEGGTSFCYSCGKYFPSEDQVATAKVNKEKIVMSGLSVATVDTYPIRGFKDRKIRLETCEFFKVRVGYNSDGEISDHFYPYPGGYKHRKLPKIFSWVGAAGGLFGQASFTGGGKRLIITEGEIDAMSCSQAMFDKYQRWYPAVSLPSSTGTKELLEAREWIRSFQEVVLCLDDDKAGQEAAQKAIKIIGIDKIKVWKPCAKDANEILVKFGADGPNKLNQCIWDAETYMPQGIITKEALWSALESYNDVVSVPYPPCLEGVNSKLKGMRMNEIALFISGSGAGKSSLFREIMLHILETTDAKIGIVSLEESPQETARKLSGMALNRNPSREEIPLADLKEGFDKVFGSDKVILLDHQGNIGESGMLDKLEYMALAGCTYIFVDHITLLTAESTESGNSGNEATDRIMAALLRLVKKHTIWLGLISHLRKSSLGGKSFEQGRMPNLDDAKGSGSLKQICFDIVAFARDLSATSEEARNSIEMSVLKSRYSGLTGPVPGAFYDYETGRLKPMTSMPIVDDL